MIFLSKGLSERVLKKGSKLRHKIIRARSRGLTVLVAENSADEAAGTLSNTLFTSLT